MEVGVGWGDGAGARQGEAGWGGDEGARWKEGSCLRLIPPTRGSLLPSSSTQACFAIILSNSLGRPFCSGLSWASPFPLEKRFWCSKEQRERHWGTWEL